MVTLPLGASRGVEELPNRQGRLYLSVCTTVILVTTWYAPIVSWVTESSTLPLPVSFEWKNRLVKRVPNLRPRLLASWSARSLRVPTRLSRPPYLRFTFAKTVLRLALLSLNRPTYAYTLRTQQNSRCEKRLPLAEGTSGPIRVGALESRRERQSPPILWHLRLACWPHDR